MLSQYTVFGNIEVDFDDEGSVKELVSEIAKKASVRSEVVDSMTVYDTKQYTVVTDTALPCRDAIVCADSGPRRGGLSFAYFVPHRFFCVEGGWDKHMKEMNATQYIDNPVSIKFRFDEFDNAVVLNGDLTERHIYDYLCRTGYIEEQDCYFCFTGTRVYEDEIIVDAQVGLYKDDPVSLVAKQYSYTICHIARNR